MTTESSTTVYDQDLMKYTTIDSNTGCFLWTLYKDLKGYGRIRFQGKIIRIHRLAAHLYLGLDLKSKLQALHKQECLNRHCWNPEHLYIGSNKDNINDRVALGRTKNGNRSKRNTCKKGHDISKDENCYVSKGQRCCKICKLAYDKRIRSIRYGN